MRLLKDYSTQAALMGVLAAFVGFAGSFTVVVQGLKAVGASTEQAASALMVLSVLMGLCGIFLSLKFRIPVSVAWSTPGAAMLASSGSLSVQFGEAIGAFIVCGVLLTLAGFIRPLARLIAAIPVSLASAMLAGILFSLCLAPVKAVSDFPIFGLILLVAWLIGGRMHKYFAVPAALIALLGITFFLITSGNATGDILEQGVFTKLVLTTPVFTVSATLSIALPLFVVTMASQNIPGISVLNANGYNPEPAPLFATSGIFSLVSAPLGGHAINLAAITAALCAGDDVHDDKKRRYWSAIMSGVFYIIFGVFAGIVTKVITIAPAILVQAVAGFALIGACSGALVSAFEKVDQREPAAVTFFITASGLSFAGISGAFWGLLCGWLVLYFKKGMVNKT